MKTKIAMCNLEIDEESMEIAISDVQKIDHLPVTLDKFCRKFMPTKAKASSGLPAVLYLGIEGLKIVGALTYGEVSFIEFEGKWSSIIREETLICIDPIHEADSTEDSSEK